MTTTSGGQVTGYITGPVGANTANTGVFTTLTATSGYQGAASGPLNGTIGETTANTGAFTTLTTSGVTYVNSATDSTSTGSGALIVAGGLGIAKNTFIGGNLSIFGDFTVQGNNTVIGSTDLTVNDSVINLHTYPNLAAWTVNDGRDIGFKLHYFDTTLAGGDNLAFLGRVNTSGFLEYFTTGIENSSNVFTSGTYGTIKTGELIASNSTVSTSTTTGALRVSGGVGIAGAIYAGSIQNTPIGSTTANTGVFTTLTATSGYQGAASGALNGTLGATTPNSVVATSVTTTSGGQVTGYITGAIGANTANTGVFTTLTATSGYQGAASGPLNGTIGATTPNSGVFTTLTATGQANINTITAATIAAGTIGNIGAVFTGASITLSSTSQAGSYTTTGGGQVTGYITGPIGSNTANTGAFTTVTSTSTITATGNIVANSGVASTTTTTGALTVNGGVGVSGAFNVGAGLNLQGNGYITTNQATASVFTGTNAISIGSSIGNTTVNNGLVATGNTWINSAGVAGNLIVQGNTTAGYSNLLVTNGFTGQVGVKVAPGSIPTSASFQVNSTDSMIVPKGTTGQRPSGGNEVAGMLRFNSSTGFLEFWSGTQWTTGGATFTTVTSDSFTGDGTTTAFTLSQAATTAGVIVLINGIAQIPTTAYSVSSTTLTFTEAPLATDIIDARTIVTTTQVSSLNDGTTSIVAANTAAVIYASVQSSNVWVANTSTYFNGGISAFNSNISLSPSTLTTVDTFSKTKFRSAKYIVTVSDFANTKYQTAEVLVVHDGTTAYANQFCVMSTTGTSFVTYAASVSGSNVILQANSTSSVSYCSVQQIYNAV